MNRRVLLILFAPLPAILLCVYVLGKLTGDVPRPSSHGEFLSLIRLAKNEEMTVATVFSHRTTRARAYRIRFGDSRPEATVCDASITWKNGAATVAPGRVLAVRQLTLADLAGLDETLRYMRETREEVTSAYHHTRIVSYRNGTEIGEEFYVGFWWPGQLAYQMRVVARAAPGDRIDFYPDLARSSGLSESRLRRMLPFEMLEPEKPQNEQSVSE